MPLFFLADDFKVEWISFRQFRSTRPVGWENVYYFTTSIDIDMPSQPFFTTCWVVYQPPWMPL
jgi:hypothetical protein